MLTAFVTVLLVPIGGYEYISFLKLSRFHVFSSIRPTKEMAWKNLLPKSLILNNESPVL